MSTLFWRSQRSGPLGWLARRRLARHAAAHSGEAVYGCALLIRADLYRSVGGLDERFFLYEEDIDLCYRVRCRGFAIVRATDVTIVHHGGQSSNRDLAPAQQQIDVFAQRLRSRSLYACKHFSRCAAWGLHASYVLTGAGFLLFSLLHSDQAVRKRRRAIGRHYLQVGLGGLR